MWAFLICGQFVKNPHISPKSHLVLEVKFVASGIYFVLRKAFEASIANFVHLLKPGLLNLLQPLLTVLFKAQLYVSLVFKCHVFVDWHVDLF